MPESHWRIRLQPGHQGAGEYCIRNNVAGGDWRVAQNPGSFDEYRRLASNSDEGNRALKTYLNAMESSGNHLCWAKVGEVYYLGRLGAWEYRDDDAAKRLHIGCSRKCEWRPIGADDVPGAVQRSFMVHSHTMCKVGGPEALAYSHYLRDGTTRPPSGAALIPLLGPLDVEDVVGLYLQSKESYLIVPQSAKAPYQRTYEWEMVHRKTGKRAVVQVKTGKATISKAALLELQELLGLGCDAVYAIVEAEQDLPSDISRIKKAGLEAFCMENPTILSDKVRGFTGWLGWTAAAAATASPR